MIRARSLGCCALVLGCVALALPAGAAAATDIGDTCTAADGEPALMFQIQSATGLPSYVVPQDGVITRWSSTFPTYPGGYSVVLKTLRATAAPGVYDVVGSSAAMMALSGVNATDTRVVVKAGDLIAIGGNPGGVVCAAASADNVVGMAVPPDPVVGSQVTTADSEPSARVPVAAKVEPDVDKDGYGDETQDLCPQSAAFQINCASPKPKAFFFPPAAKQLKLILTALHQGTVDATGEIKIKAAGAKKAKKIRFKSKKVAVTPGKIVPITLKFPKSLRTALKGYPAAKKFKLKVTLSGYGPTSKDTSVKRITLRGAKK